jgi:1-acyl-sn-glycerol-3-phosphate acyltransferase
MSDRPYLSLLIGGPARLLRPGMEYLAFYFALLYFGVGGVVCTCVCALLYPLLPPAAGARLGRNAIGFLFRTYLALLAGIGLLRVDLRALDALRDQPRLIIAPNHPSLLDAVLVISRVPELGCIMKAPIWDNPVLGGGARLSRYIRNDSPRAMLRGAVRELRAGHALLVFPEGTRTRSGTVDRFRGGFALIAKRAGAAVQTVFIETNSAYLTKGWPLLRKPDLPLEYSVRLGRRFQVQGDLREFVTALERYYAEELAPAPAPRPDVAAGNGAVDVESREQWHA